MMLPKLQAGKSRKRRVRKVTSDLPADETDEDSEPGVDCDAEDVTNSICIDEDFQHQGTEDDGE